MRGRLITVEGIDGSGKGTQTELLLESLQSVGRPVKKFTFPGYDETFFGKQVGAFLRGDFGTIDQVHPKLASVLFACDRLEQKPFIENYLADGYDVICDRYVESNMGHQAAKIDSAIDQHAMIMWLEELEYGVHKMPRPDITFFLDVPIEVSREMVLKKKQRSYTDQKEDIHEAAHGYLEKVYHVYQFLAEHFNWTVVPCVSDGEMLSMEDISSVLKEKVI